MKLNNYKNVHQALLAINAKRLFYYSKLCELYQDLAKIMINTEGRSQVTASDIEQRYAEVLSSVSYNEVDNLDILHQKGNFTKEETDIISEYSSYSGEFINFTNAYNMLKNSIIEDTKEVDEQKISDFHDFMDKASDRTSNLDLYLSLHSNEVIGLNYYNMYNKSLDKINSIDQSHLENVKSNESSDRQGRLSRKAFGIKPLSYKPVDSANI